MALATVKVRTTLLPDLDAEVDPSAPAGPGSLMLRILRPEFHVESPIGSYTRAPWGSPGETRWPLVAALLVLGVGLAILYLARR